MQKGPAAQTIQHMDPEKMRQIAMELDEAIMNRNAEDALSFFHDDCQIEMFGLRLEGSEGARRWIHWLLNELNAMEFIPITIMVQGNSLFEEFTLKAELFDGERLETREAVVLSFRDEKVSGLHLYMDRLEIAEHLRSRFIRFIVGVVERLSTSGLGE